MEHKNRIHPRLKDWDYRNIGGYFITVCVKDRKRVLSTIPGFSAESVGRAALSPPLPRLLPAGEILNKYIQNIEKVYSGVFVDKYVIMPNHFHILLRISASEECGGLRAARPTVSTVIRSLKTMVTRELGRNIWQTSFYDHIIRDEQDYLTRWKYIDDNPAKWAEDEYYIKDK